MGESEKTQMEVKEVEELLMVMIFPLEMEHEISVAVVDCLHLVVMRNHMMVMMIMMEVNEQ